MVKMDSVWAQSIRNGRTSIYRIVGQFNSSEEEKLENWGEMKNGWERMRWFAFSLNFIWKEMMSGWFKWTTKYSEAIELEIFIAIE